jgi:hypothetical protein
MDSTVAQNRATFDAKWLVVSSTHGRLLNER